MTEIDEIRRKYDEGGLDYIKADLERFISVHAADIERFRAEHHKRGLPPLNDETAVKFFIIRCRSINPAKEITEQLAEIEREKWIRGIQDGCAPDGQVVALDWARNYSAGWRAHRVTSIIYVFDREKEKFLHLLKPAPPSSNQAPCAM